jgi:hypothetical protein
MLQQNLRTRDPIVLGHMVKDRKFVLKFYNIPESTVVAVFDHANKESVAGFRDKFDLGSTSKEYTIPLAWENPWIAIRTKIYYLIKPYSYMSIAGLNNLLIDGGMYYLDISHEDEAETINQQTVESLVYKPTGLSGRERFYVALIALQSHFEYLIYMMLVTSGYTSKTKYKDLKVQCKRIPVAFSKNNNHFFTDNIPLKPGVIYSQKSVDWSEIAKIEDMFKIICRLRNHVVHGWSLPKNKADRQRIVKDLQALEEQIYDIGSDEEFYSNVSNILVRLWAKSNPINARAQIFRERMWINEDRKTRGY